MVNFNNSPSILYTSLRFYLAKFFLPIGCEVKEKTGARELAPGKV
jgi:hypothetical protein